jgi:phage replication-related protein YjqB (UPF0714/DUF867 family)
MDRFTSFAQLDLSVVRGRDYDIDHVHCPSARVAVIAPHGGSIEPQTSEIAQLIAAAGFSYYSFKGIRKSENATLHITSHNFDEPTCLALLAAHDYVVAVHGCAESGEAVLMGGLDTPLLDELATALSACGINVSTSGHRFPAREPRNICNRGRRAKGVQVELTRAFRNGAHVPLFVSVFQRILAAWQRAA